MDSEEGGKDGRGEKWKRRRDLEKKVSTYEMLIENQYTHIFSRWHVDFMLRACCRGVGEVRDKKTTGSMSHTSEKWTLAILIYIDTGSV
jgi:hypothetical protein